jgi:hypothetical protein
MEESARRLTEWRPRVACLGVGRAGRTEELTAAPAGSWQAEGRRKRSPASANRLPRLSVDDPGWPLPLDPSAPCPAVGPRPPGRRPRHQPRCCRHGAASPPSPAPDRAERGLGPPDHLHPHERPTRRPSRVRRIFDPNQAGRYATRRWVAAPPVWQRVKTGYPTLAVWTPRSATRPPRPTPSRLRSPASTRTPSPANAPPGTTAGRSPGLPMTTERRPGAFGDRAGGSGGAAARWRADGLSEGQGMPVFKEPGCGRARDRDDVGCSGPPSRCRATGEPRSADHDGRSGLHGRCSPDRDRER